LHTLFTTLRTHILGIKDGVEVSITHKRKADEVLTAPALAFELLEPSDLPLESISRVYQGQRLWSYEGQTVCSTEAGGDLNNYEVLCIQFMAHVFSANVVPHIGSRKLDYVYAYAQSVCTSTTAYSESYCMMFSSIVAIAGKMDTS
jgi:hypothetical protein